MQDSSARAFFFTIIIAVCAFSCEKKEETPIVKETPLPAVVAFAKGADVSWLTEMEAAGLRFKDSTGSEKDLFSILRGLGVNTIRLWVWVNPQNG